jgi:hypothetical protein
MFDTAFLASLITCFMRSWLRAIVKMGGKGEPFLEARTSARMCRVPTNDHHPC